MSDLSWGGPMDPQRNAERFLAEIGNVAEEEEKPRCESCLWYHPKVINGREIPCTFHIRPPEGECERFRPLPPVHLCRQCQHSRWGCADRPPSCRRTKPGFDNGSCPSFEPRTPVEPLPCPTCGEALEVVDGEAKCPQGHTWKLRRSSKGICPRCGERYGTFGFRTDRHNRRVFRLCHDPGCRWHSHVDAYVGPPLGRQKHGGQRYSPVTGRALARTP
jgi:hypothetical protein